MFLDSEHQNLSRIEALRYEHSCHDNAAEEAYGILLRRSEPIPLYELRLVEGTRFLRIFPIAYVDGAFRFLLSPDFRPPAPKNDEKNPDSDKKSAPRASKPPPPRVAVGGNVQAAKLIKRVQPIYPDKARHEFVFGTVKVHAVVGKDGQISRILGVHGVCSLAESAVDAVRQWRYSPTLLEGQPVEIDTEIDVNFSLSR
jgi:TonB family protein